MPYSYEDYDVKSKTYTNLRQALGFDKELAFFKNNPTNSVEQQRLLDAGCGTGNYSIRYVDHFAHVQCFDFNQGMLRQTRLRLAKKFFGEIECNRKNEAFLCEDNVENSNFENGNIKRIVGSNCGIDKLKEKESVVSVHQGNICELPYANESFDAICVNQVVHHLRSANDFSDLRNAVKEFYRVLRNEGRCAVNWIPNGDGHWWKELVPEAMKKFEARSPTVEKIQEIFTDAGFSEIMIEPIFDEFLYNPELYLNPAKYVDVDRYIPMCSIFNMATDEELKTGVAKVQHMINVGSLDTWFAQKERLRKSIGQTVMLYAIKKND